MVTVCAAPSVVHALWALDVILEEGEAPLHVMYEGVRTIQCAPVESYCEPIALDPQSDFFTV